MRVCPQQRGGPTGVQDLLSTALDLPTGKWPLDMPTCSTLSPRRLRAARRLAATERRIKGRSALAPARAPAGRLRSACTRRCSTLRRRLAPRAGAAPDQGARGLEGEGGNAPSLAPRQSPVAARACPQPREGQLECKIYSHLR